MLNTDAYVNTVAPIATDPAVTATLARIATNQLFAALDPQAKIADALPPKAAFLAGPITNGVKGFIQDQANNVLNSDQFQQLWVTANRKAHEELVKVLRGDSKALVDLERPGCAERRAAAEPDPAECRSRPFRASPARTSRCPN